MNRPTFTRTDAQRGECFHNVFNFILANPGWVAVHGIARGQGPIAGLRIGHAWGEVDHDGVRWVYDPSSDALLPAVVYYAVGDIQHACRYTAREVATHALRTGHSGPWDETVNQAASKTTVSPVKKERPCPTRRSPRRTATARSRRQSRR